MNRCQLCHFDLVGPALDLGNQPISNRFVSDPTADEALFPLSVSQCGRCGLVQIDQPAPAEELRPRVSWITYNEPEAHLDDLAATIARLPGLDKNAVIWGLSFKDDSLLKRLAALGFTRTHRLDPLADLNVTTAGAGIESFQLALTADRARAIAHRTGRPALVIARHFIEHAQKLGELLTAVKGVLAGPGYSVIEIPDCQTPFRHLDYTTLWEERPLYFTAATFPAIFAGLGQRIVSVQSFAHRPEGLLVGIGQLSAGAEQFECTSTDQSTFERFATSHATIGRRIADALRREERVAVLGAGHLAVAFISYLGLASSIRFVADDNPNKQGLFMPGSKLPILPSARLAEDNIALCLLSVNPEIEAKVIERNRAFIDNGGRFASIFATSGRYILA